MDDTEKLLKELTETSGVAGYEQDIREVVRRYFQPLGELEQDKLGSLICRQRGQSDSPRVVMANHMDEIGFMVKHITKEGFIRFTALGGWWDQVLLAQRVMIMTSKENVRGVIGAKPPHVLAEEERKKVVEKRDMYIDIGAVSQQEVVDAGVRIGDPIVPVAEFVVLNNPRTYMAKAFDDRIGCAAAIKIMQGMLGKSHPNTLFAAATVQEEVGTRGAVTSVELINPDVAIVLEVEIAGDVPGIKPEESSVKLTGGPVVLAYDARMIPNQRLRDFIIDTARERNIPLQVSAMEGGATDGGPIHLHKTGVPTVVLAVPTRHIHCHSAIVHRDDFDRTVELGMAVVEKLDAATVVGFTAW